MPTPTAQMLELKTRLDKFTVDRTQADAPMYQKIADEAYALGCPEYIRVLSMPNPARDRAEVAVACLFISGADSSSDEECECAVPGTCLEKLLLRTVLKQREEIDALKDQVATHIRDRVALAQEGQRVLRSMADKTAGKRKR